MQNKLTTKTNPTIPFRGTCNTYLEPAVLDSGSYSMAQNFRQMHPGMKKRPGQIKLNTTADPANVMTLFQFSKGGKATAERHFYAQMSDGTVIEATGAPPTVTNAAFGSDVFTGSSLSIPGSWAVFADFNLFANGVDLPQIYPGTGEYVDNFFLYWGNLGSQDIADISSGTDYSLEVSDGNVVGAATYADIGNIGSFTIAEGSELLTNGTFATDSGWTKGGDWTIPELMTLDVAPATAWVVGNTITGQTSAKTCVIVKILSTVEYWVTARSGAFTLGEVLTNGTVTADQGAANPTFAIVGVASYGGGADVAGATVITNGTFTTDAGWTKEAGWAIDTGNSNVAEYGGVADVLGTEKITNGTFDTDTGWTKETGWTIDAANSNKAEYGGNGDGIGRALTQSIAGLTPGDTYRLSLDVTLPEGDDFFYNHVWFGIYSLGWQVTPGSHTLPGGTVTYTQEFIAAATTAVVGIICDYLVTGVSVDNVSLKTFALGGGTKAIKQTLSALTVGAEYRYSVDVVHNGEAGKTICLYIGGRLQEAYTASGTYTGTYYPAATTEEIKVTCDCTITGSTIDNVILNAYLTGGGIHAIQQTIPALVVGTQYAYSIDVVHNGETDFPVSLWIGTRLLESATASGTYSGFFTARVADTVFFACSGAPSIGCTIDNLTLNTYAEFASDKPGCLFVKTPVPCHSLGFIVSSANGSAAVVAVKYWSGKAFTGVSGLSDTTIAAGASFAVDGSITWNAPTDEKESYFFSGVGYWYMIYISSGATDSETRLSSVTYEAGWQPIANLWDGVLVDVIEAQLYTASTGKYTTYAAEAISLDAMTSSDELYFSSYDDIESIAIEALTPNATGDTLSLSRWTGSGWGSVPIIDTTAGFTRSGRILFARGASVKRNFNYATYQAHWYRLKTGSTLAATVLIGLRVQPYYNISEFGKCIALAAWKNRMVYAFSEDPNYVVITAEASPQVINGDTYDMKSTGDGRKNKIVCMKPFYNELMVFQSEAGVNGGTITLFDGYDVDTFGKLVLSSKYGTMNSQSAEVVEGFSFGQEADTAMVVFFLSRYGVFYTDGKVVSHVPNFDDIRNYFDPSNSNSIRLGYESKMWLKYDSAFNILRIGLVTGSDATSCNTFLTYDLLDLTWGVDVFAQELSAFTECEAGSGNIPVLQVGGGTDDGFVYLLNNGLNDVSTAIDAYVTLEYDTGGDILHIDEMIFRAKTQAAGSITVTPALNSIAQTAFTLEQTVERATQTIRRHRKKVDLTGQHISLKIQHNTASESCYLEDMRLNIRELSEQ